jgi:hypothetical protein
MTCEDLQPVRITWVIELYEPHSQVWMGRGLGRATTAAAPLDIAQAVLAGYLTAMPPRSDEVFRAVVRTDTGTVCTVTADGLPEGAWEVTPAVRQALPLYLRDALAGG